MTHQHFLYLLFLIIWTAVCAAWKCDKLEKDIEHLKRQIPDHNQTVETP